MNSAKHILLIFAVVLVLSQGIESHPWLREDKPGHVCFTDVCISRRIACRNGNKPGFCKPVGIACRCVSNGEDEEELKYEEDVLKDLQGWVDE